MSSGTRGSHQASAASGTSSMRQLSVSTQQRHATTSKHDIHYLLNSSTVPPVESNRFRQQTPISSSSRQIKSKSKDRPFECAICNFSFAQRSDRNKHIRTVHYGERPFTCEYCGQNFGEKGNLNKHIRSLHEKKKPFKCPECPSEFAFQDGLSRHIDMVHRETRPFKCPDKSCDKAFKQKAHAEKHFSSVHQKLKPCVCFCGAAFRENYNMKQHQKAVHNIDPQ